MTSPSAPPTSRNLSPPTGAKYVMFRLGDTEYGIDILRVREIVAMLPVTSLPRSPAHVRGVVNLRGQVIPVVDLRLRFGMEAAADERNTCVVVCATPHGEVGCVVDEVLEVLAIANEEIEALPELPGGIRVPFVAAVAKSAGRVQAVLDVDAALSLVGNEGEARDAGDPA